MNHVPLQEISGPNQGWKNTPPSDPSFACIRCWKLKKKCDKSSPQCKRCASAGINCVYSEQPPTGRKVVTRYLQTNLPAAHTSSDHAAAMASSLLPKNDLPPRLEVALPNLFSVPNDALPSPDSDSAADFPFSDRKAVSRLAAPIYTPFHAIKHEIGEILSLYLQTLNTWLPVITDAQIPQLLNGDGSTPDAETCTLLLSIYLVTKQPAHGTSLDSLYTGLKRFHSNLHTISSRSIPIIQAGMLLAIYEQGQSLHQLSYLTIGACVRIGQAIGLHRTLQIDLNIAGTNRTMLEQQRHVWWSLVILERILALESLDEFRPFASASPSIYDYLPSFWPLASAPDGAIELGISSSTYSNLPTITFPTTSPFGKSAQATYLLTKVLEHTTNNRQEEGLRQVEWGHLDQLLQRFMGHALDESSRVDGKEWNHSCVPFFIVMCALLRLHKHNLTLTQHLTDPVSEASFQRSILALQMIARVGSESKDVSNQVGARGEDKFLNEFNMPPFLLIATRDVALVALYMIRNKVGNEEWWRDIVRFYVDGFGLARRKWRLANEYLEFIVSEESKF